MTLENTHENAQDERLRAIWGDAGVSALHGKCAAILGVGALGAWSVHHFAMLGVERLILVDIGLVDPPNLGNQLFDAAHLGMSKVEARRAQVLRIHPTCRVDTWCTRVEQLGFGVLRDADVVLCCLDSLHVRLAWVTECCKRLGLPWVDAATDGTGARMYGRIASFGGAAEAPCALCSYDEAKLRAVQAAPSGGCPTWWTRGEQEPSPTLSASPESAIVAGLQCNEAIRRLLDRDPPEVSRETIVNLDRGSEMLLPLSLTANLACTMPHIPFEGLVPLGPRSAVTLRDTFVRAERDLGGTVALQLHHKALLARVRCITCGREKDVGTMDFLFGPDEAMCACGASIAPLPSALLAEFSRADVSPQLDQRWSDLGLPAEDIVTAHNRRGRKHYLVN